MSRLVDILKTLFPTKKEREKDKARHASLMEDQEVARGRFDQSLEDLHMIAIRFADPEGDGEK